MTTVTVFEDPTGIHRGFEISGHAGWADKGGDIVCAAISVLTITTVNSIETFALKEGEYEETVDDEGGYVKLEFYRAGHDTQLLIDSMLLGLRELEQKYPEYIRIIIRKV